MSYMLWYIGPKGELFFGMNYIVFCNPMISVFSLVSFSHVTQSARYVFMRMSTPENNYGKHSTGQTK